MKAVSAALGAFSQEDIAKLEKEGKITLSIEKEPLDIALEEVEITSEDIPGWMVAKRTPYRSPGCDCYPRTGTGRQCPRIGKSYSEDKKGQGI